jgi:hypothetical protein
VLMLEVKQELKFVSKTMNFWLLCVNPGAIHQQRCTPFTHI